MDNFKIDVTSEGEDMLVFALAIAKQHHAAVGYRIDSDQGLILYWAQGPVMNLFMSPIKSSEILAKQIMGWLDTVDYGPEPDHDGHNGKGWRLYSPKDWQAFAVVIPVWAQYGK